MINRVVIVGRLTKDPELRYTPQGLAVVRFTVAVNRTFTGSNGEREADFISCVAWRKQAENLANFQKKGALIGVEGRIQTGSYEGNDGKRVYTTEVVSDSIQFLEPRSNNGGGQQPNQGGYGSQGGQQPNQGGYAPQGGQQPSYGGQQGGFGNTPQQDPFGGFGGQQPPAQQQNYTRMDEDPFASSKGPIEVSEDDLPF